MSGMTEATQVQTWPTTAHRSAGPITVGLGGLILGAGLFAVGADGALPVASIVGSAAFLVGLVVLLDGVHKLVRNFDAATQALLERRPAPPS
jgi:uncharacterized membrane protein HdeD (DUF308 family)